MNAICSGARGATALALLVGSWVLLGPRVASAACDQTLSPGDKVSTAISNAPAGATICLNDGVYGGISLTGVDKGSAVTVQSMNGAASVNVGDLNLDGVSYVTLNDVTFTGGILKGHHLQITNSIGAAHILNGVSQILKIYGSGANASILIDHVKYVDIPNPCTNNACVEGRISIMGGGNPSGITISNSYFSGGNSDGMQVSGNAGGVQIIGNEFAEIRAASGTHTDSIQLYGQGPGTVIKGNYFHDSDDGIMAGDGGNGEQILDNVFDLTGYPYGIVMDNWQNSVIRHNTFKYGTSCSWNSCGTLWVRGSTNLVVEDNIIGELKVDSGSLSEDYNLINVGASAHDHTIIGLPAYAAGVNPTTYAGFRLASGSAGKGAASDGEDMGADYTASSAPDAGRGSPDAGRGSPDAGPGSPGAGPGVPDASPGSPNASPGSPDSGSGNPNVGGDSLASSSAGCSVGHTGRRPSPEWLLVAGLTILVGRRRRHRVPSRSTM